MDLRNMSSYGLSEAAHYIRIPQATLPWIRGRPYPTTSGVKQFRSVILIPDAKSSSLFFTALVKRMS